MTVTRRRPAGRCRIASPVLTWTGSLAVGRDRDGHVLGHGEQSRYRGQDPGQHGGVGRRRGATARPGSTDAAVLGGGAGAGPGADHRRRPRARHCGAGVGGALHGHGRPTPGRPPIPGRRSPTPLAGVLDDAAYNGDAARDRRAPCPTPARSLSWTGSLAPGATATVTFSVTVNNPDTGEHMLAITVTSAAAGSNCAAGGSDPRCAVTVTWRSWRSSDSRTWRRRRRAAVVGSPRRSPTPGRSPYTGITIATDLRRGAGRCHVPTGTDRDLGHADGHRHRRCRGPGTSRWAAR